MMDSLYPPFLTLHNSRTVLCWCFGDLVNHLVDMVPFCLTEPKFLNVIKNDAVAVVKNLVADPHSTPCQHSNVSMYMHTRL